MPPQKARGGRSHTQKKISLLSTAVHAVLILAFGAVWAWHLTPKANEQEVAKKKGWFFEGIADRKEPCCQSSQCVCKARMRHIKEYYTFAGFTLQLLQFLVALAADLTRKASVIRAADDISCAAVPVVLFITAFYYCLLISGNIVDSDDVPSWVSPALHTGNFGGMLADLFVSAKHRTFRTSSSILSASINFVYMIFLYFSSRADGCYPYAFLESMPEPFGIVLSALVLVVGVEVLFLIARRLKTVLL